MKQPSMTRKITLLALLGVFLGLALAMEDNKAMADDKAMADEPVTVTLLRWPYT